MKKMFIVLVFVVLLSACMQNNFQQINIYHVSCYSNSTLIYEHDITVIDICGVNNICSWETVRVKEVDTEKVVSLSPSSCVFVEK